MPRTSPQCPHIARKRGVYHYRRRLPQRPDAEIMLSLGTRDWREAEHLAGLLDRTFGRVWSAVVDASDGEERLRAALREELRERLNEDVQRRVKRPFGEAVYAHWWDPEGKTESIKQADLKEIGAQISSLRYELDHSQPQFATTERAETLIQCHGVPEALRPHLIMGLIETRIKAWEQIEKRTRGQAPIVSLEEPPARTSMQTVASELTAAAPSPATAKPPKPLVSALVEPFFERRKGRDRATNQVMQQDRGTLRRFIECCGDRPVDAYDRGDVTRFLDTLRKLPATYGKSPADKEVPLVDLIARADAGGLKRLTEEVAGLIRTAR